MEENSSKPCREVFDDMCNSTKRVKMYFQTMSTNNIASVIQILEEAVKKNKFDSTVKQSFEISYQCCLTGNTKVDTLNICIPLTPIILGISTECWIKLHPIIENHCVIGYSFETTYFLGKGFSFTRNKKKKEDNLLQDFINSMENNIYSNTSKICFLKKNGNDSIKWYQIPEKIVTLVSEKKDINKRLIEKKIKLKLHQEPYLRDSYPTNYEVFENFEKNNVNTVIISKLREMRLNKDQLLGITYDNLLDIGIDYDQIDNILKANCKFSMKVENEINEDTSYEILIQTEIKSIENELNAKTKEIEKIKSEYETKSRTIDLNQDNYDTFPGEMVKTGICVTAIGAWAGSVIPVIGTAIGAGIGFAVGLGGFGGKI